MAVVIIIDVHALFLNENQLSINAFIMIKNSRVNECISRIIENFNDDSVQKYYCNLTIMG
jgi:hypothetical protein